MHTVRRGRGNFYILSFSIMRSGRILPDFDYSPLSVHREQVLGSFEDSADPTLVADELAPNLAVIEELEEIRDMIESKSRDLFQKEILLSQSMDQMQLHKLELMETVEYESSKMLAVAEARLDAKFGSGVKKLEQLISRIEARITHLREVQARVEIEDRVCASTPPIPGELDTTHSVDILDIFSSNVPSIRTQLVASCIYLVLGQSIGISGERFFLRSALNYVRDAIDSRFQELFETSLRVDIGENEKENDSKFQQAQRGVLLRRINVSQSLCSQPIEIHIHQRFGNQEGPGGKISLKYETRKHQRMSTLWTDLTARVDNDLKEISLMNPLNPLHESQETQIVHAAINTRFTSRGFMFRIASIVFNHTVNDNDIQALSKSLNSDTISATDRFVAFQVGMFLLEWLRDQNNAKVSETVIIRMMENALNQNSKDYEALVQLVSNWKQGLWNMLRVCVCLQTAPSDERMFYMRILDSMYPRDLIAAWAPTIIARIEKGLIHEKLVGRVKTLIQCRPG